MFEILYKFIPSRSGYTFIGWSTTPDSDTINYLYADQIPDPSGDELGVVYYAIWIKK